MHSTNNIILFIMINIIILVWGINTDVYGFIDVYPSNIILEDTLGEVGNQIQLAVRVSSAGDKFAAFDVHLKILRHFDELYHEIVPVSGVWPNAENTITFPQFHIAQPGVLRIIAITELSEDENPVNDTLRVKFWAYSSVFLYDFETDSLFESNGDWEWGHPTSGPWGAHSGYNLWATDLDGAYSNNSYSLLTTHYFNLTENPILGFWSWYLTITNEDGCNVKISTNGGNSWELLHPVYGYDDVASVDNPLYPDSIFTGYSNGQFWQYEIFDLKNYEGEEAIFRFDFGSNNEIPSWGWYIDDFTITCGIEITGSLFGTIRDRITNDPIEGVIISISSKEDTSDFAGEFYIDSITPGIHEANLIHSEYFDTSITNIGIISGDMFILDVSLRTIQTGDIEYVGSCLTPGQPIDVFIDNNYAYLPNFYEGLQIVDISEPRNPQIVGNYLNPNYDGALSVYVKENYACLGNATIEIIDISDPSRPEYLEDYATQGFGRGIFMKDEYAYVAASNSRGGYFYIFDITMPHYYIFPVGSCQGLDYCRDVFVEGGYAYVADDDGGLSVIDVSDPSNPTVVGGYIYPNAYGICVNNNYAYLVGSGYLLIFDVSDPTNPGLIGDFATANLATDIYIQGNFAYIANDILQIVDISNPVNPTLYSTYDTPSWAYGVSVSGKYIYIADSEEMLILRFEGQPFGSIEGIITDENSEPIECVLINVLNTNSYDTSNVSGYYFLDNVYEGPVDISFSHPCFIDTFILGVQITENETTTVNIELESSGILAGIISDSNNGTPIANVYIEMINSQIHCFSNAMGEYVIDNIQPGENDFLFSHDDYHDSLFNNLIIESEDTTFFSVEMRETQEIEFVGYCQTPGEAYYVCIEDNNYAYIADGTAGLQIIDISIPESPEIISNVEAPENVTRVFISGNYAYITDTYIGLLIIDVTDPRFPVYITYYPTLIHACGVFVSENYAYVLAGPWYDDGIFYIIDVSDPSSPILAGTYPIIGNSVRRDVYVKDNYAYLLIKDDLIVLNVANSSNPTFVGSYEYYGRELKRLFILDNYAFITAIFPHKLLIIDISNPANPTRTGLFEMFQMHPIGVFVQDGYAYVANYTDGIKVIDVLNNPTWPSLQAGFDTPGYAWGIVASKNYLYVAADEDFLILSYSYSGKIEGVVDNGDLPIHGVYVNALNTSISDTTGEDGSFLLENLRPGNYNICFSHPDYADTTMNLIRVIIGNTTILNVTMQTSRTSDNEVNLLPDKFTLSQNYPNPLNSATIINYTLPYESHVAINVYDVLGRKVVKLIDKKQTAGYKSLIWSGLNNAGDKVSSGIYFYKIQTDDFTDTKKMVLLK